MLRFFRVNDPYRLVFIFLLMIVIRFIQSYFIEDVSLYELKWLLLGEWLGNGFTMYSEAFDYTGPLSAFVFKYLNLVFGRSSFSHYAVSSLVIILQAGIFNQILLKNKAYGENSYLPAFLYVILMVSVPDFMILSPQLLSLTFILLALRNVLRRIDNQVTDELFLNSGIFIGIASMIYLPSAVFLIVFLFSLILFSSAVSRRVLLYLFSFFLIFVLCSLYFFWRGDFSVFLDTYIIRNIALSSSYPVDLLDSFLISAGFGVVFFLSVFKTWSSSRLTNFQQKIQQVIWLMFFGGIATFFLSNEKSLHELVFLVPVITYFWVHYFILLSKPIFKVVMPGLMIFGMISYSLFCYRNMTSELVVNKPASIQPSTMILGENISYYLDQEMLTPCFHDQLCEVGFEGLSYYAASAKIYKILVRADPNIIIDEIGVMPAIINRFPQIEKSYNKNGREYTKISN